MKTLSIYFDINEDVEFINSKNIYHIRADEKLLQQIGNEENIKDKAINFYEDTDKIYIDDALVWQGNFVTNKKAFTIYSSYNGVSLVSVTNW